MKTKHLLLWIGGLAIVLAGPLAFSTVNAEKVPALFRDLPFEAALKTAADEQKVVFVDFFTTWCGPCKMLDRTTWQDPEVIALLQSKAIPLKIDAEKEVELAKRYGIQAYPTLLILRPNGEVIDRLAGYKDPKTFVSEFQLALEGKTALERAQARVTAAKGDKIEELRARYDLAELLVQEGKHADALSEFLWLFDEGMKRVAAFTGVRRSYLLNAIAMLARTYPPALEALHERRDAALARLETDADDRDAAEDFAAINRTLHEDHLTLSAYDNLPAGDPRRRTLGPLVFDHLVESKRYGDAVNAQPTEEFLQRFEKRVPSAWGDTAAKADPDLRRALQSIQVNNAAKQIEALAGAGRLDEARRILARLRQLDDSRDTQAILKKHLERAGQPDLLRR